MSIQKLFNKLKVQSIKFKNKKVMNDELCDTDINIPFIFKNTC